MAHNHCWWCGAPADSREHKYKRSDLIREFGSGPYAGPNAVSRILTGNETHPQGPNSNQFKFQNTICQKCNNERSQPFDSAYDQFVRYLKSNESNVLNIRSFDWSKIFGLKWEIGMLDVHRYYVKHICCRLAEDSFLIHPTLISFLDGNNWFAGLQFEAEVRADIAEALAWLRSEGLEDGAAWIGDIHYWISKKTGVITDLASFIGYRWLRVNYHYDLAIPSGLSNLASKIPSLSEARNMMPNDMPWVKDVNKRNV